MDRATARYLLSDNFNPLQRPDVQYWVSPQAKALLDSDGDGQISRDELVEGLVRDQVSIDPKTREIIANRSRMAIDTALMPKNQGNFGTVEQCMEFIMRYFRESRGKMGRGGPSFDQEFGNQHDLAGDVRQLASGRLVKPGYDGYLNGSITPPRAGDILAADNPGTDEFHVALVTAVEPRGYGWEVTVFQANVPFNTNGARLEDHLQKLPLRYDDGHWTLPALPTSHLGYNGDLDVVGWIHPEGDKALPGAAA